MSSQSNENRRDRSRQRCGRRWRRDRVTGRLVSNSDDDRSRSRSRERGRDRSRRQTNGTRQTNERDINATREETNDDDALLSTNETTIDRMIAAFENNDIPSVPNLDSEMEQVLGIHGVRLFEQSAMFLSQLMQRYPQRMPLLMRELLNYYVDLRRIHEISDERQRANEWEQFHQNIMERQMQEQRANAVIGTDLNALQLCLTNLRGMMYDTLGQLNTNQFTLQLTMDIEGVSTAFNDILVCRLPIPDEQHRKISKDEEKLNENDDGFECGICIERFKQNESVTTLKNCKHEFHKQCVSQWIKDKGTCPLCRGKQIQFKCVSDIGTVFI